MTGRRKPRTAAKLGIDYTDNDGHDGHGPWGPATNQEQS